jgi:uncharacterized protein
VAFEQDGSAVRVRHGGIRWAQLLTGVTGFGLAIALMIRSGLGLGPWDAFHLGIHELTGISVGTASVLVGLVIIVGTLKLGIRPGFGTVANMALIGIVIDLSLAYVPEAQGWVEGLGYYAVGIVVVGLATGMYIGAGLGNGPRDGLILGIAMRRGWSIRRVRTVIELFVLGLGWGMGGTIGVGTVIFALSIGPVTQIGLQLFDAIPRTPAAPDPVRARSWPRAPGQTV